MIINYPILKDKTVKEKILIYDKMNEKEIRNSLLIYLMGFLGSINNYLLPESCNR